MALFQQMKEERIAEIRKREKKATKGPWNDIFTGPAVGKYEVGRQREMDDEEDRHVIADFDVAYGDGVPARKRHPKQVRADISFVAHARQDIPFLLAEIERLRKENKELKKTMKRKK